MGIRAFLAAFVAVSLAYLLFLLALLVTGAIGLVVFLLLLILTPVVALALLAAAYPLLFAAVIVPALLIVILALSLNFVLALVLTVILLWLGDMAFEKAFGLNLLPFGEEGGLVWWRVLLAVILFLSVYSLLARLTVRREARGPLLSA
ncbi:MAG: hypothetical protein NZ902_06410 [Acidilobaceae archaeon]|nr:hypothetical protein [Acidilobaceae archaeon]MCX8166158.1 hypothetical protein [Acidilobaceae archaeon]MDW7974796.1 hypothetical protein [Sulfolobales archaeon]